MLNPSPDMSYFVQYNSLTISNLPYKWFYFISYLRVARFSSLTNCIFNLVYIRFLNFLFIMIMKAKCGHVTERSYAEAHNGLCRRCHSNFSFILELEQRYGEDALVEYWYSKIASSGGQIELCLVIIPYLPSLLNSDMQRYESNILLLYLIALIPSGISLWQEAHVIFVLMHLYIHHEIYVLVPGIVLKWENSLFQTFYVRFCFLISDSFTKNIKIWLLHSIVDIRL